MKNYFLKSFFWILLFVVAVSCSKSESTPEPDAATQVAGEYKVTEMTTGGITITEAMITLAQGTVTITMTRKEANIAEMRFYAKIGTNVTDEKSNVLVEKSGNVIILKDFTQKIGQYENGKLEINGTDASGAKLSLKATKK